MHRIPLILLLASLLTLGHLAPGLAPVPVVAAPDPVESSGEQLVTATAQQAIDRGLEFLAQRQLDNGAFGSGGIFRQNVGVTSLCGMAFLSAGHTPGKGKYGQNVHKAVEFILSRANQNGFIVDDSSKSHGPMYGHGFATLFLAETYGTMRGPHLKEDRKRLREALERAVNLIINSQVVIDQREKASGWRYHTNSQDADISVTVCQIMALRAARNSGIYVPAEVIDSAMRYVMGCQNTDGGFRYQLHRRADSVFPRSAAALVAFYSAGIYEGPELEKGLNYLMRYLPRGELFRHDSHYFYGHYYAVQAMWQAGGDYWFQWYPAIRDELVKRQMTTGAWSDSSICTEYGTAMALLVLQMPNNYLPIFQR